MSALVWAAHVLAMLAFPVLFTGVVTRTKAFVEGRHGPSFLQLAFDVARLLHKEPVTSAVCTPLFRLVPLVVLSTCIVAACVVPLIGAAPLSFPYDFVVFSVLFALQRAALVLGALDTGSPFEGMGAAREALWGALVEPAFILVAATLVAASGEASLAQMLQGAHGDGSVIVVITCAAALLLLLQVEAGRVPVDDPKTHLELTMIHEVMILDHSGPELAALLAASALKLATFGALVAALLNPFDFAEAPALSLVVHSVLLVGTAVGVGAMECFVARMRISFVPRYVLLASLAALTGLLVTTGLVGIGRGFP